MAAIDLRPYLPRSWTPEPRLVSFNSDLVPSLGGAAQRSQRLGTRWAVSLADMQDLEPEAGRALVGQLVKAQASASTVKVSWPNPGVKDAYGSPLVNGASQAGMTLACDGFTAGATIRPGWVSVTVSSRSYLYMVTDQTSANGSGVVSALPIAPMLRASPADNAVLEFANPVLEGFVTGTVTPWRLDMSTYYGFAAIEIVEAA